MSWDSPFPDPIIVPQGEPLATLRDAGACITSLPLKIHDARAWQTAMECLLLAADKGGPIKFARHGAGDPTYAGAGVPAA